LLETPAPHRKWRWRRGPLRRHRPRMVRRHMLGAVSLRPQGNMKQVHVARAAIPQEPHEHEFVHEAPDARTSAKGGRAGPSATRQGACCGTSLGGAPQESTLRSHREQDGYQRGACCLSSRCDRMLCKGRWSHAARPRAPFAEPPARGRGRGGCLTAGPPREIASASSRRRLGPSTLGPIRSTRPHLVATWQPSPSGADDSAVAPPTPPRPRKLRHG